MNTALTSHLDGERRPRPRSRSWNRFSLALMGAAGGMALNDLSGTLGYPGLAAVLAIGGVLAVRAWILELDPRALLRRRTSWVFFRLNARAWLPRASLLCFRIAVLLVGQKRWEVREEWRSHVTGWAGGGLSRQEHVGAPCGFLWAAVRYRFEDAADLAWRPVDAVLGSRTLSNLFVWGPVVATLVAIVHHDGRFGLVADDQDPVALGAFLYVVIKTGRWWRQIKLPEPKPRRAKE